MAADVKIDIAAEFTGKKAFKQAETATDKMSKNVKKLAGAFGLAFGTTQILAYGKASVRAAAEDQKAQKQLALALKNVGLGRDAASTEDYIQRLQSEFGIVDDKLRPAYQTLAIATQDSEQSQRLLNLALDISASSGKDLSAVTAALSKAYLGNNTSLGKLGVGISKADLKAQSFEEIVGKLETTFAGAATASANTFQGSIDKLGVAAANVSEIIGTGLIDALTNLGENTSVSELASNMEKTAIYIADVIRGIGVMTSKLKDLPVLGNFNVGMIPIVGSYLEILRKAGVKTGDVKASDNAHLKALQTQFAIIKKTATVRTKLTAAELKALQAAKLKNAIDKANLALNKGSEVFDMDKIQIAAALTSQAEQLGKATSSAQVMQIANDTARLNVKKSILALEDAIASKDEAAITAATKKLNEDLKILGALGMQNVKLQDIKSVLDTLQPKDLINLNNLTAAIALLEQLLSMQAKTATPTSTAAATQTILSNFKGTTASAFESLTPSQQATLGGYAPFVGSNMSNLPPATFGGSGVGLGDNGTGRQIPVQAGVNITVNTGIGDPNAIAEAIDQVLTDAAQRGTLRGYTIA